MPPLENLVIGGECSSIGAALAMAVILGGLFLLYQALDPLPDPTARGSLGDGGDADFAVLILTTDIVSVLCSADVSIPNCLAWQRLVTFVNDEILSSPLLLMLFFIATMPGLSLMTGR